MTDNTKTSDIGVKINKIITEYLGEYSTEGMHPNSNFVDDLGADSLDAIEITMALEEEFSIEIPNDEIEKIKTVQDAILLVESKL